MVRSQVSPAPAPQADLEPSKVTIGALAQAAGVHHETIRYYQRLGLLDQPDRPYGSIRRYGPSHLERLRFIQRAQRLGFTLAEIASLFHLDAHRDRQEAQALAQRKLAEMDDKLHDLHAMRKALKALAHACATGDESLPCPIVEAFRTT